MTGEFDRCHLFLGEFGCVFETSIMSSRERRVFNEEVVHSVAIGEHVDDLMNRNPRAPDACLPMADIRINPRFDLTARFSLR